MHTAPAVHTPNRPPQEGWPTRTRTITHLNNAWVVHSHGEDFDPDDLTLVRRRFPGRHVTLDGDVITVWPHPREL
ncbi:hypothetical protein ACIF8T_35475 [Streptomyces sp. NPDC085946]|uniref:hypothetical protein n=1 Tax=Streptomyces sp. NPDC085946 TaxID=3365744 RepID=UPI0037D720C8